MKILIIIGLSIVGFVCLGYCVYSIAKDMGGIIGTAIGERYGRK